LAPLTSVSFSSGSEYCAKRRLPFFVLTHPLGQHRGETESL
jgi:hypothetical protein